MPEKFPRIRVIYSLITMAIIVLGSVGIDQATKHKAESELKVWAHDSDLKSYRGMRHGLVEFGEWTPKDSEQKFFLAFAFNYVRNQGAAWGTFSDLDDSIRVPFFYLVTLVAIFVIILYIRSTPPEHRIARFALTLVFSGALGNLLDRFILGYVIDFIDVRWILPLPFSDSWSWRYNFPNFNWADSCISVGVCFLIIDMIFLEPKRIKSLNSAEK